MSKRKKKWELTISQRRKIAEIVTAGKYFVDFDNRGNAIVTQKSQYDYVVSKVKISRRGRIRKMKS